MRMILGIMVAVCAAAYLIVILYDFFRLYKTKHYKIRCNICGSEDTVIKNNDREDSYSNTIRFQKVKYLERNPPSFYCNKCKKEYDYREGTWIKKHH